MTCSAAQLVALSTLRVTPPIMSVASNMGTIAAGTMMLYEAMALIAYPDAVVCARNTTSHAVGSAIGALYVAFKAAAPPRPYYIMQVPVRVYTPYTQTRINHT